MSEVHQILSWALPTVVAVLSLFLNAVQLRRAAATAAAAAAPTASAAAAAAAPILPISNPLPLPNLPAAAMAIPAAIEAARVRLAAGDNLSQHPATAADALLAAADNAAQTLRALTDAAAGARPIAALSSSSSAPSLAQSPPTPVHNEWATVRRRVPS